MVIDKRIDAFFKEIFGPNWPQQKWLWMLLDDLCACQSQEKAKSAICFAINAGMLRFLADTGRKFTVSAKTLRQAADKQRRAFSLFIDLNLPAAA